MRILLLVVSLLGAVIGWRTFCFLTDDAYIAFRYVSNRMLGYGFVWNPPPFQPVEGYTSLLWVVLLELVWRLTGIEPPVASNWLSLVFGCATLVLVARLVERLSLPAPLTRHRLLLVALVLIGTVTNRTFLTWLSSGLETALFNFCCTWWLYGALTPQGERGQWWIASFTGSAAAIALARPDGLLFFAATLFLLGLHVREMRRDAVLSIPRLAPLALLLVVPAHLCWRRLYYGLWLPNTYYAKHVAAWPESGIRYLMSFIVEYGLWVLVVIGLMALVAVLRSRKRERGGALSGMLATHFAASTAIAILVIHFAYYTFVIGGDHFEYRVYSHLVPLLLVAAVWLASRVTRRIGTAMALLAVLVLASWPIPWAHWSATRNMTTREETNFLIQPMADRLPFWMRPLTVPWDRWQDWLIRHYVCMRHQEHKIFHEEQVRFLPSRAQGSQIRWERRAVLARGNVGVPGWVFPEVAIIDLFGLNDRVIARSPIKAGGERRMAHDRDPIPDYVRCFRPNVVLLEGRAMVNRRQLTDAEILACEERDWLDAGDGGSGSE